MASALRAAARLAAGVAVLAVLAGGCTDLPGSGAVQYTSTQLGAVQAQGLPQLIPVPPGRDWSPVEIVEGFLTASASFASDHVIAREYLTPQAARTWQPGWAATVIKRPPQVKTKSLPLGAQSAGGSTQSSTATVTGPTLATLTDSGQYLPARGAKPKLNFVLEKIAGQWRISQLPSRNSLILTQSAFESDYGPRNLYFYSKSGSSLVPDPVFVPQQRSPQEPASGLVSALLRQGPASPAPAGWLNGATATSFPPGTTLLGVSITATSAVVDLGGAIARASRQVLRHVEAQIVWTLTSSSYSPSAITSVQLRIDGRPVTQRLLLQQQFSSPKWLPHRPASSVYYLNRYRGVSELAGTARPVTLPWPVQAQVTGIAVAPGGGEIAGIVPGRGGCQITAAPPARDAEVLTRRVTGGRCTALSFDSQGNIWAAAGSRVWWLPEDGGAAVPVTTPGAVLASDTITALRVAPDGVRIAMIVRGRTGPASVLLGAISHSGTLQGRPSGQLQIPQMLAIGPGIANPTALTWYNADYVLVLSDAGRADSQLYEVPLNGGAAQAIPTQPDMISVTAAGSETGVGGQLFAGAADGQILRSAGPNAIWFPVTAGTGPVYPG